MICFIFILYVLVLCLHVHKYRVYVWCLWQSKKGALVLETEVINKCKVFVGAGTQTLVLRTTELCMQ